MIKHTCTEHAKINFSKLESRILAINDPVIGKFNQIKDMIKKLRDTGKPIMIVATGGSKVVAYYLQLILESFCICEVIEPRDYFYKVNREMFSSLIVISASGNTNGINEIIKNFSGNKYLICEKEKDIDCEVISWGNELYEREKSFISLATSLGPITLLLDAITLLNLEISPGEIEEINKKIKKLLMFCSTKIDRLEIDFKDVSLIQILSGYETKTSSSVLESNLVEVGLSAPVIHDKGSYCHGRSNLLFRYPDSHMIYLAHQLKDLDYMLINSIKDEYPNLTVFNTDDLDENRLWKEYYLILQMYFLSRKIADDKNIDLTMPEYNRRLVKNMYNFRGEM